MICINNIFQTVFQLKFSSEILKYFKYTFFFFFYFHDYSYFQHIYFFIIYLFILLFLYTKWAELSHCDRIIKRRESWAEKGCDSR